MTHVARGVVVRLIEDRLRMQLLCVSAVRFSAVATAHVVAGGISAQKRKQHAPPVIADAREHGSEGVACEATGCGGKLICSSTILSRFTICSPMYLLSRALLGQPLRLLGCTCTGMRMHRDAHVKGTWMHI